MNDLISRQAAIEIIQSMYPGMPRVPWMLKNWQKQYEPYIRLEEEIQNLPSAQRWIPVTERLPEDDVQVLCTDSEGFVYIAWHCDYDILEKTKCWCDVHYCSLPEDDIIAWMPLPEPYAERREE